MTHQHSKSSWVWMHFSETKDELTHSYIVKCNSCNYTYSIKYDDKGVKTHSSTSGNAQCLSSTSVCILYI
jgi:hypothetical protein